ncbi:MAG: hypothetical protein JRF56_08295 [Deltaproteobacteria bacterium]|jgi:uncharacterized protein (DUF433 family)|nr:hypothetical protein [Deltaproteobacteria bacterium]
MTTVQKSIRLPEEAVKEIEALASGTDKDFSSIARDLLIEAVKMRRCPGITFADGPTGRRARIAGSGIDIWEFIASFKGLGENYDKLKETYHWLSDQQIRSALAYYTLYPDEIDEKITRNEDITQAQVIKRFPFLSKTAGKK